MIDEVIAGLKADKIWKGDTSQQRRFIQSFAWITGDLPLGDCDHRHVSIFKDGLHCLPKSFRFGSAKSGAISRPFADVVADLSAVKSDQKRNLKTINRDLSTMSAVAKRLALTVWKPRIPNTVVLDFASATVAIKDEATAELRPPWTRAHMKILFSSPIYKGNGGCLK